jgi:hypothetical protein
MKGVLVLLLGFGLWVRVGKFGVVYSNIIIHESSASRRAA